MVKSRFANKKDTNHKEITDTIAELRDKYNIPINFTDTHMIKGFCDFVLEFGGKRVNNSNKEETDWIVGVDGMVVLVEVKQSKKKITRKEDFYLNKCAGAYIKIEDFDQLIYGLAFLITDPKLKHELQRMNIAWVLIKKSRA